MNAVTQAELEELVMGTLDARPITCGTVRNLLDDAGVDVKRSAVERALKRLGEKNKVGHVWAPCEREGRIWQGRHYYDAELFAQKSWVDDDPLDFCGGGDEPSDYNV